MSDERLLASLSRSCKVCLFTDGEFGTTRDFHQAVSRRPKFRLDRRYAIGGVCILNMAHIYVVWQKKFDSPIVLSGGDAITFNLDAVRINGVPLWKLFLTESKPDWARDGF